jgi:hypothetical protein
VSDDLATGEVLRFERGDLSLVVYPSGGAMLYRSEVGWHEEVDEQIMLDVDELRWLVLTVGPAALVAGVAPLPGTAAAEAVAEGGGGPPPASADGTEPPNGQLGLDDASEPPLDSPLG